MTGWHKWICACALMIATFECFGQVNTTYIRPYERNLALSIFTADKFTDLTHEISASNEMRYRPNTPLNLGIGISWRGLGFNLSHGVFPVEGKKTEHTDLQCHLYTRNFVVDLFGQDYKGFYADENGKESEIFRDDLRLMKIGGFAQYIINGKRFSYRAGFGHSEWQLRSAGSMLAGVGLYYIRIDANESISEDGAEMRRL